MDGNKLSSAQRSPRICRSFANREKEFYPKIFARFKGRSVPVFRSEGLAPLITVK